MNNQQYNPHMNPPNQNQGPSNYNDQGFDDQPFGQEDRPLFAAEDDGGEIKSLSNSSRNGFITKVYGILAYQLTITVGFIACAFKFEDFKEYILVHQWLMWVALVVAIICQYALFCYRPIARSVPINYIILTVFTVCYSYVVASATIHYPLKTVLYAAGLTLLMVVCLTIYAQFMGDEIFFCLGFLVMSVVILLVASIVAWFVHIAWLEYLIAVCSVIVFSIYLIFDTKMIIGNGKYALQIDEYIFAAMVLYVDIIEIFLNL